MATPTQVANRTQPAPPERHHTGTVAIAGYPSAVALDPGGAATMATPTSGAAYPAGTRVLVLITPHGNYIIGRLTPAA